MGMTLSAVQTMTVTNLHSLASSATAGWQSDQVDNTSNLYDFIDVQIVLDFANTAPANDKCVYVFAATGLETGVLSNPASGAQGAITLTNVTNTGTNLVPLGEIPYTTQDEVAESKTFRLYDVSAFWSLVLMNYSGAALAASGNTVKWRGGSYA